MKPRPNVPTKPTYSQRTQTGPSQRVPVAPPVYRPQPVPRVLQTKSARTKQSNTVQRPATPVAPPAFRPQPVPKVLQTKKKPGNAPSLPVKAKNVVGAVSGRSSTVQAKIVFGPRVAAQKSMVGPRAHSPAATGSPRNSSIQRKVIWGHHPDSGELVITEVFFDRPTGTSNAGAHTTAISIFQQTAMEAVRGRTYEDAKRGFWAIFNDLMLMPGARASVNDEVEAASRMIRDGVGLADESIQANWTSNLEDLAKLYIHAREKLDFTHHQAGMGGRGNAGEGPALTNLHDLLAAAGNQWHLIDKVKGLAFLKKVIDLRNVPPTISGEDLGPQLAQHLATLNSTYRGLIGSGLDLAFLDDACRTLNVPGPTRMYVMQYYQQYRQLTGV